MPLRLTTRTGRVKILAATTLLAPMVASAHLIAIAATTPFPSSVNTSSSAAAVYTITNISTIPLTGIEDQSGDRLPLGVSISASTCSSTSALNPGASCTINLQLAAPTTATVLSGGLYEHPLPSADGVFSAIGPITINAAIGVPVITVGYYDSGQTVAPLIYARSAAASAPWVPSLPTGVSNNLNLLLGSSCSSDKRYCSAVGYYLNTNNITQPLSYTSADTGATWNVSTGLATAQGSGNNYLRSVACNSTGQHCSAVGYYNISGNNYAPASYISTNFGQSWDLSATPPPSQGTDNRLYSVACDAAGDYCTAVGDYVGINTQATTISSFTSHDGGNHWVASLTLSPPDNSAQLLFSVACGTTTGQHCTAVGFYSPAGVETPLSYYSTDAGVHWQLSTGLPTNLTTDHQLESVACDSTGMLCTAVGQYTNSSAQIVPESYYSTTGGATWALANTAPMALGNHSNYLNSVTCDNSGQLCTAVGYYFLDTDIAAPLSYTTADGGVNWSLSASLPAAQSVYNNVLTADS